MAFTLLDLVEKLGHNPAGAHPTKCREFFREEAASLKSITPAEVKQLFPNVEMSSSSQLVYAPLRMCHSMPKRNARGRAFTSTTLANSFPSAKHALVNLDHEMKKSGGKSDSIIGHIVASRFDPDGKYLSEAASSGDKKVYIPSEPVPMLALAALYMRNQYVPKLLEEHLSGSRKWHTSMECGHEMEEASFYYRGEFLPVKDCEAGMRECVEKLAVRPYKGHELTLCLGGLDGFVDFWGMAMTPQPADGDSKVMAFLTPDCFAEAANAGGKSLCFPLETRFFQDASPPAENPPVPVDSRVSELANIAILGTTQEADGHTHDILSDGTIVPNNGHTHYLANWNVARGTVPFFTGRTDLHYQYLPAQDGCCERQSVAHMHLIDVSLRGKAPATDTTIVDATASVGASPVDFSAELSHLPLLTANHAEESMDKLLAKLAAMLSSGKMDGPEAAALKSEIANFKQSAAVKDAVQAEIASLVKAGELYPKVAHDEAMKAAEAAAKAKADAELVLLKKQTERREAVMGLGLNPEAELPSLGKKIGDFIGGFGADEQGEKSYQLAFDSLKLVAEAEKAKVTPASAATATATTGAEAVVGAAKTEEVNTAAASKGGTPAKPGVTKQPAKPALLLVGAGGAAPAEEEANAEVAAAGTKKVGRHAFSK